MERRGLQTRCLRPSPPLEAEGNGVEGGEEAGGGFITIAQVAAFEQQQVEPWEGQEEQEEEDIGTEGRGWWLHSSSP